MANSVTATYVAVAIGSFTFGYLAGVGSSLGFTRTPDIHIPKTSHPDSDEEEAENDLASVNAGPVEPCKLVLVVRTDLGMTKGKIGAQCGHATLACYKALLKSNPSLVHHWERTGQTKIAVQCKDEEEMLLLQATAQSLNLCARAIQDAGRTQIAAGSLTVLGIGPGPSGLVDQVTKHLKLL